MRVLIILALIGAAVAVPKRGSRIVGGQPTVIAEYPFMTNMQYHYWGLYWDQACGGSLITTRTSLTAAHCFYGELVSYWRVRLGTSYATSGGSVHDILSVLVHEHYDDVTLVNDVAIVTLATPAVLSSQIQTTRIAGPNYNLPDGTPVTAIGWGALEPSGHYPEQLQRVEINIINQQLCAERYAYLRTQPGFENWPDVTSGMLCAGILNVGGKDACQGDSGGPLIYSGDIVVGVTSWGYSCAHYFYPGVNARVSYFSDWIVANGST